MSTCILIIEDDQDTSDTLKIIAEYLNLTVVSSNRIIPVSEIQNLSPGLILLDHWVYDELGATLCLELKNNPSTKHIPVIMLSAHNNIAQISAKSCADGYLEKPFDLDELTTVINRHFID